MGTVLEGGRGGVWDTGDGGWEMGGEVGEAKHLGEGKV